MLSNNSLPQETREFLKLIPSLINKTFPIPARFRGRLPSQIAELSHLLTNRRGERNLSYLGQVKFLSAYLYYFLPWNIYRLCVILHNEIITLKANDIITDIGSGPLTFICALWIMRPDLRKIPLEINCIDRSLTALEAGKKFFDAVCSNSGSGENVSWKINLIRKDIDTRRTDIIDKKKPAALVCAINIFNEIYENIQHNNSSKLEKAAFNAAGLMHNQAKKDASILIVEPGVPQSGKFISLLRTAFMELDRPPVSPCTHAKTCPCVKKRWCHFAFDTVDAPKELKSLSAAAKIPKERLVFSYLLTGSVSKAAAGNSTEPQTVRIISDAFAMPNSRFGCYGCSSHGLVLLTGKKNSVKKMISGSLFSSGLFTGKHDAKSGGIIMEIE